MGAPFAKRGSPNVADALAALAIVRSLIAELRRKNLITDGEFDRIITDAHDQISMTYPNEGRQEARRVIEASRSW
jgi:hypothetical protein